MTIQRLLSPSVGVADALELGVDVDRRVDREGAAPSHDQHEHRGDRPDDRRSGVSSVSQWPSCHEVIRSVTGRCRRRCPRLPSAHENRKEGRFPVLPRRRERSCDTKPVGFLTATVGRRAVADPYPEPPCARSGSSPTPTGTGSGTPRSRRTGCSSCTCVDDLLDLLEGDAVVHPVPARRPDRGGRRLPRGAPRRRGRASPRSSPPGALQIGPWMILMDEFMVSGETIVRDLQLGLARADALGGDAAMRVGYLPDMFGHVAQMPQILRLAGLEHAVVWRGVPRDGRPHRVLVGRARRFDACAPSTSTARTRTAATSPTIPSSSSRARAATTPSSATPRSPAAACC